jgi:hypothetical protein
MLSNSTTKHEKNIRVESHIQAPKSGEKKMLSNIKSLTALLNAFSSSADTGSAGREKELLKIAISSLKFPTNPSDSGQSFSF